MKITSKIIKIILGCSLIINTSCRNKAHETFRENLLKSVREDRLLDTDECNNLKDYIKNNPKEKEYEHLFIDGKVDENLFLDYLSNYLTDELKGYGDVKISCKKDIQPTVNIYIENSGSMDGYINGNTIYKSNLSDLIVQTRGLYGVSKTNTFFVNSNAYKTSSEDIKEFISKLSVNNSEYKQGNTSTSELNETIKLILSKSNDDNISLLLSDFIYSLDKNQHTQDGLGIGKSLTKDAFLQHLNKHNISTFILKFNSDFNGKYYSYDNSVASYKGQRPYYILVLGQNQTLIKFIKQIQLNSLKGFENSYYISNYENLKPQYEVFDSKENIGHYKVSRKSSKDEIILDDVQSENGLFKFTVAVDFSDLPDQNILLQSSNYNIKGDFKIISIDKRTNSFINKNFSSGISNKVKQSTATHFITLESTQSNFDKKLAIQMTNKKPNWIKNSSTENDKNISQNKLTTFGFNYFIDGIYEAYKLKNNNTNNDFLSLNFTLNK